VCYQSANSEPPVDNFINIVSDKMDSAKLTDKLRGNALWALAHIARHPASSVNKLFALTDRLVAIFECTDGHPSCIINAAWALTNVCATHANQAVALISRSDVFLHLSGLLRAPFPRTIEKAAIFRNVCAMLTPAVDKITPELWPAFLAAAATAEDVVTDDDVLQGALRSLLRKVRATLGGAGWTRASQEIGPQMACILRRRYKLY
jgi:hypothetical protein